MKKLFTVFGLLILSLLMLSCIPDPRQPTMEEKQASEERKERDNQWVADEVISNMLFIKDPRTNSCHTYVSMGGFHGGPAMTTIPCETIPADLLITAKYPTK